MGAEFLAFGIGSGSKLGLVNRGRSICPRLLWLVLLLVSCRLWAAEDANYRVAVIRDDDSWYFDAMVERFIQELEPLAKDRYEVLFDHSLNAKGEFELLPGFIDQAMADSEVNLIYTAGVVATEIAAGLSDRDRIKPVIGGALQMVDGSLMELTRGGASQFHNYTFITNPRRVRADLEFLYSLDQAKTIHVLIDREVIRHLSVLEDGVGFFENELPVEKLVVVGAAKTAQETLDSLPDGIEAMYVALQPRMDDAERARLFAGLAERGIRTVSMWGRLDVNLGALAGLESDTRSAVARRIALNIHQLLQGVEPGSLPTYLPVQDRIVVNMGTARVTGWSPSYDLSIVAEFINTEANIDSQPLNLVEAMKMARENNAAVNIAEEEPRIQREEIQITRSNLLPTSNLISRYGGTRYTEIINPLMTPRFAKQASLGVQLQQLLYSDTVISAWRAQKRALVSAELQLESARLDAAFEAVGAYLDVLSARALREIERQNLTLTENNLALAKLRRDIGAAEPAEVFRWERDQARNRAALIQRDYQVKNAMVVLNQVLGTPRERVWDLEDIYLGNEDYYFLGNQLNTLVQNYSEFERFGFFLQRFAVLASPELASFDYGLVGQGILLRQKKRRFYLPDLALSASASRVGSRSSFQGYDEQNEMTVGIELSFPLLTGGERRAAVRKQEAEIRKLNRQREQAEQQLELGALVAKNNIGSAHPNIRLNRISLAKAESLYESILQKYSLGATDYLNLLDAQQALIIQRQQEALAVYDYLLEIHRLQRAIAWFEFDKTEAEKDALVGLLTTYLESGLFPEGTKEPSWLGREVRGAAAAVLESVTGE